MVPGEGVVGILIHLSLGFSPRGTWSCVTFSHGDRGQELGSCLTKWQ